MQFIHLKIAIIRWLGMLQILWFMDLLKTIMHKKIMSMKIILK